MTAINNIIRDAHDQKQPKKVNALQASQQDESDDLADPALVLLRVPVEDVGADGGEFGEGGVQDAEVEVVAQVDPDADEEGEVGDDDGGVDVVEAFGRLRFRTPIS